ncbi:uncharacterized [Tachysurus ichikawai]
MQALSKQSEMGKAGENFIGIPEQEVVRSDIPLHVCLSDYFKGESERRVGVIREKGEVTVNGPGGVRALSERPLRMSERHKIKALCQHTSKARRHLNKFSQVSCLGPEHEEAECRRKSHSELMHNERVPAKTVGSNNTDIPRTWSRDLMAIE